MPLICTSANSNYFEKIEVRWLFLFGQISTRLIKRTELSHIAHNTEI